MIKKLFVCAVFAVSVAGCKQGIGEHCQVNHDCATGACSMSLPRVCVAEETIFDGGGFDTRLPPDALRDAPTGTTDATVIDAPSDSGVNAPRDSANDAPADSTTDSGP